MASWRYSSAISVGIAFALDDASATRVPACHAAALAPMIERPRVALGTWDYTLTVTNIGAAPCLLPGYPAMRIEDAQGRVIPTTNGMFLPGDDAGGAVVLQPGQQAATDVRWNNRCPQATARDAFLLRVSFGGDSDAFAVSIGAPPCLGDTQPSGFDQGSFALTGDAVQVVRAYYGAINRRDYPAAYALVGAQMQQQQSSDDFATGFATTEEDDLHVIAATMNDDQTVITITLTARLTDGTTPRYAGAYTVGVEGGTRRIIAARIARHVAALPNDRPVCLT